MSLGGIRRQPIQSRCPPRPRSAPVVPQDLDRPDICPRCHAEGFTCGRPSAVRAMSLRVSSAAHVSAALQGVANGHVQAGHGTPAELLVTHSHTSVEHEDCGTSSSSGALVSCNFVQAPGCRLNPSLDLRNHGPDSEDVILEAFKVLDPSGQGKIPNKVLLDALTCEASRFNKEEVDALMEFAPVDVGGNLDYKALCYIITHGQEE